MPTRVVDDVDHDVAPAVLVERFVDEPFAAVVIELCIDEPFVAAVVVVFVFVDAVVIFGAVLVELRGIEHAGRRVVFVVDAVAEQQRAVRSSEEGQGQLVSLGSLLRRRRNPSAREVRVRR